MSYGPYYGERQSGLPAQVEEEISEGAWCGIIAAINKRVGDASFAYSYPFVCSEKGLPYGCDPYQFSVALRGVVPALPWPLKPDPRPSTLDILSIVEFCHREVAAAYEIDESPSVAEMIEHLGRMSKPMRCHKHLEFNVEEGEEDFCEEINSIFARYGIAYQLNEDGHITRLLPEELQSPLQKVEFHTGDVELDSLLEDARRKFLNPDPETRQESLRKLWYAWERLKTLEPGKDKKQQVAALLAKAGSEPKFIAQLDKEGIELTNIGNSFGIRHSETTQTPLERNEHVDYLFSRLFSLVHLLLKTSGRSR